MLKKAIILISFYWITLLFGQDLSIFFLKDGSILQGKVVNENQTRVFLKTEQGTIKILQQDILGREDLAKSGDLTYIKDQLDYIQANVRQVSGEMTYLHDSIKVAVDELFQLYKNLEVLHNEFEIDLLRVHGQTREQKMNLQSVEKQVAHNKVDIAVGNQSRGMILDTLSLLGKKQKKDHQSLENTSNQTFLISGSVNQLDNDLHSTKQSLDTQQNQINIISNSLANVIREVETIQSIFTQINNDISANRESIHSLTTDFQTQTALLAQDIEASRNEFNQMMTRLETLIKEVESKTVTNRNELQKELKQIESDIKKINSTLAQPTQAQ